MTTIINSPGGGEETSSLVSTLVAIIVLVLAAGLFFVYVWPNIREVEAPKTDTIDVNVTLPPTDKVDN